MKKNFTKLVSLAAASLCVLSVVGQERVPAIGMGETIVAVERDDVRLRAEGETIYWWPDSVITYDYIGEPTAKSLYDKEQQTRTYSYLQDGSWVHDEPHSSNGYGFLEPGLRYSTGDDGEFWYGVTTLWWTGGPAYDNQWTSNTVYDNNGNLTLLEVTLAASLSPVVINKYRGYYNNNNNPVLVEYYWYDELYQYSQYEYNENGLLTQVKRFNLNEDNNLLELNQLETVKFDEKGRPIEGHDLWLKSGERSTYHRFYYSDGTNTPTIAPENNTTVGDSNKGSFDLDINIPADSINNGSMVITLPEGFTLDRVNTRLTLDFSGKFALKITKQDDNSWLLEITPRSTRSTSLRADDAKTLLNVAYSVDPSTKLGTYDIVVNSILFESKGGAYYPEPAITIPANVTRGGVSNDLIGTAAPKAYIANNTLYIQSAQSEQITVYTLTGTKLYESTGATTIDASAFPQGILIVKGNNWTVKVNN